MVGKQNLCPGSKIVFELRQNRKMCRPLSRWWQFCRFWSNWNIPFLEQLGIHFSPKTINNHFSSIPTQSSVSTFSLASSVKLLGVVFERSMIVTLVFVILSSPAMFLWQLLKRLCVAIFTFRIANGSNLIGRFPQITDVEVVCTNIVI